MKKLIMVLLITLMGLTVGCSSDQSELDEEYVATRKEELEPVANYIADLYNNADLTNEYRVPMSANVNFEFDSAWSLHIDITLSSEIDDYSESQYRTMVFTDNEDDFLQTMENLEHIVSDDGDGLSLQGGIFIKVHTIDGTEIAKAGYAGISNYYLWLLGDSEYEYTLESPSF